MAQRRVEPFSFMQINRMLMLYRLAVSSFQHFCLPRGKRSQLCPLSSWFCATSIETLTILFSTVFGMWPLVGRYQLQDRQPEWDRKLLFRNMLMWRYGRAFPIKITIEDAVEMRSECVLNSLHSAAGPLKRCHMDSDCSGRPAKKTSKKLSHTISYTT